mmetsp:Transcript_3206/g.9276  ORF Transcript_3206/g.9276 Transcript_3206/m.9276 type:complete len:214 (-) Transcript_3206:4200-4841(-)
MGQERGRPPPRRRLGGRRVGARLCLPRLALRRAGLPRDAQRAVPRPGGAQARHAARVHRRRDRRRRRGLPRPHRGGGRQRGRGVRPAPPPDGGGRGERGAAPDALPRDDRRQARDRAQARGQGRRHLDPRGQGLHLSLGLLLHPLADALRPRGLHVRRRREPVRRLRRGAAPHRARPARDRGEGHDRHVGAERRGVEPARRLARRARRQERRL